MYRILYNGQILHDPESDDRVVNDVSCMLSLVSASTLQLTVPKTNPLSGTFECMRRDREVTLERDGETVFRGRILTLDTDFWGNEVITAESERSYLNDVLLPPFSTDGSIGVTVPSDPAGFFCWCILQYNAKQEGNHQFRFGFNQANELTDTIQANQEEWKSVWEAIKVRLMQRYGGWVRVRYSEGLPYIDYLTDSNQVNAQTVKFGENLLDYTDAKNGSELYTRILPTSQNGATIAALPDGTVAPGIVKQGEWVVSQTLENLYGVIEYVETFETEDPNKLLQDGIKRVKQVEVGSSLSITAFDLAMVDPTVSYIEPGDYVRVVSPPHGIDEYFICWEREIHPTDPAQDKINLGTTDIKLTTAQAQKLQELDDNKANVNLANATVEVVSDVKTVYAVSNSDSTQPSTWTASIPTTTDTYLWSKTTVTDVDGTEDEQAVVTMNPRAAGEASQYVTYVSTGADAGLHIHENASDYDVDGDLHLDSGGVEIRDSGTVLASFGASLIELGVNSTQAVISLMNRIGEIRAYIVNSVVQFMELVCGSGVSLSTKGGDAPGNSIVARLTVETQNISLRGADSYSTTEMEVTPTGIELNGNPLFSWNRLAKTTGTGSAAIDLTGYSEVMVVANVLRNSARHIFTTSVPIVRPTTTPEINDTDATIYSAAYEYKLGGYVGANASTSGGAWCSLSLTSFAGAQVYINNSPFISATTWTVYAR